MQVLYHWGPQAWAFYALVGGAIAYGSFRHGRTPVISSIFAPLLGEGRTGGALGRTIDIFSIIVTLFGTAASLGLGALQIGHGIEIVSGIGELGNGILIAVIAVLTACFIASAVSGVSRGIRASGERCSVPTSQAAVMQFWPRLALSVISTRPRDGAKSNRCGVSVRTIRPSSRWRCVPRREPTGPENDPVCRFDTRIGASSGRQSS